MMTIIIIITNEVLRFPDLQQYFCPYREKDLFLNTY